MEPNLYTRRGDAHLVLNWSTCKRNLQVIPQRNGTSARFAALSSIEAFEFLSLSPSRDLGVCGESDSSCWPRKTTVPLEEASSKEA